MAAFETPEMRQQRLANIANVMSRPYVRSAYEKDPRTLIANKMLAQGTDMSPVEGGVTEGIARALSGLAGGYVARQQTDKFGSADQLANLAREQGLQKPIDEAVIPQVQGYAPQAAAPSISGGPANMNAINPDAVYAEPQAGAAQVAAAMTPQGAAQTVPLAANPTRTPVSRGNVYGAAPSPRRQAPTDAVAERRRVGDSEGPMALGGYNAQAYNTSGNSNKAGLQAVPLTQMTIGQVLNYQRGPMRAKTRGFRGPNDVGSTGVGRYQFESDTLEDRAKKVFGANYKNVPFNRQNQDALFDSHYADHAKAGTLGTQWNIYKSSGGTSSTGGEGEHVPHDLPGGYEGEAPGIPQMERTELPPEAQDVARPEFKDRVRSTRLQIVQNLLNSGQQSGLNASLRGGLIDEFLEEGLNEDQASKMQRSENEDQLDYLNYQMQLSRQNQRDNTRGQAIADEYKATGDFNREAQLEAYKNAYGTYQQDRDNAFTDRRDVQAHNFRMEELDRDAQWEALRQQNIGTNYEDRWRWSSDGRKYFDELGDKIDTSQKIIDATKRVDALNQQIVGGGLSGQILQDTQRAYDSARAELDGLRNELVTDKLGGLGHAISDSDVSFMKTSLPLGSDSRPEVRAETSRRLRILALRQQEYNKALRDTVYDNFFNGDRGKFARYFDEYKNEVPLVRGGKFIDDNQYMPFNVWIVTKYGGKK